MTYKTAVQISTLDEYDSRVLAAFKERGEVCKKGRGLRLESVGCQLERDRDMRREKTEEKREDDLLRDRAVPRPTD